ncbi:hypothetical protein PGT21_017262 [Puccinia graminis f. sp. tritici]|uniref:Uncharacterized protein n=1 Tax=Puccinia graminis f. sp. tritici TaxID=56615 RepID=A0A5B0P652_PUCGR|nr:hypothetical protein PGT21_017262 [Puccinia graminis f. sp. tritici]KAA1131978.1 hypothetical protein PGTUg99_035169 [Puccinia graminis f. sp. tritici]
MIRGPYDPLIVPSSSADLVLASRLPFASLLLDLPIIKRDSLYSFHNWKLELKILFLFLFFENLSVFPGYISSALTEDRLFDNRNFQFRNVIINRDLRVELDTSGSYFAMENNKTTRSKSSARKDPDVLPGGNGSNLVNPPRGAENSAPKGAEINIITPTSDPPESDGEESVNPIAKKSK